MPLVFGPNGDGKTKIVSEARERGNIKFVNGETLITIPSEEEWWAPLTDKQIGHRYSSFLDELGGADPSLFVFFNSMVGPLKKWYDERRTNQEVLILAPLDECIQRNFTQDEVNLPKFTLARAQNDADSLNRFANQNSLAKIRPKLEDSSHDVGQQVMLQHLTAP